MPTELEKTNKYTRELHTGFAIVSPLKINKFISKVKIVDCFKFYLNLVT